MWNTIRKALRRETRRKLDRAIGGLPIMEQLDKRVLMSVQLLSTGTLEIIGSNGTLVGDFFEIQPVGTNVVVRTLAGSQTFPLSSVKRVYADLNDGGDILQTILGPKGEIFTKPMEVYGEGGIDQITTGAGKDRVQGGNSGDLIKTGDGDDVIYGYISSYVGSVDDPDVIDAGAGNDRVYGGPDNDTIYGRYGCDELCGNEGNDTISGDDGNDVIVGDTGDDELHGGADMDNIDGGAGYDKLYGDGQNDVLSGGSEDDIIEGGTDNDVISGSSGIDWIYGGPGRDYVEGGSENDHIWGQEGDDELVDCSGDDEIYGGSENDVLRGGPGVDTLSGEDNDDTLHGGSHADCLYGGEGCDRLFGDEGADQLAGQAGHDDLYGGSGQDVLSGGDGRDGLFGGYDGEEDQLTGGDGSDRFLNIITGYTVWLIKNWEDNVTDRVSEDARIGFEDGNEIAAEFSGQSGDYTYDAGTWTDGEIQLIDSALRILHDATQNNTLLERASGLFSDEIDILRHGSLVTATGSFTCGGWNDGADIHLVNACFAGSDEEAVEILLHEVGHYWDTEYDECGWWCLSGWEKDPSSTSGMTQGDDDSGDYWYDSGEEFVSTYAKTNPDEDFAESFANYCMNLGGLNFGGDLVDISLIGNKDGFFDDMMADLA